MARWNGRPEVWSRGVDGKEVLDGAPHPRVYRRPIPSALCVCCRHTHKTIPMRLACGEISFHSTLTGGEYPS